MKFHFLAWALRTSTILGFTTPTVSKLPTLGTDTSLSSYFSSPFSGGYGGGYGTGFSPSETYVNEDGTAESNYEGYLNGRYDFRGAGGPYMDPMRSMGGPMVRRGRRGGYMRGLVGNRPSLAEQVLRTQRPIQIQGNSLKTWVTNPNVEAVHVALKSEGRPIHADVELWNGPNNIPYKLRVYVEDGYIRPCSFVVGTPRGTNTVAVRNISPIEFPMEAAVAPENEVDAPSIGETPVRNPPMAIQGNSLHTFRFNHNIQAVQVMLRTDGRPLNARIELWQGPNNVKQVVDIYTDDGLDRPFYMIIDTPGHENVVRVANTATIEFPLDASVEAYSVGENDYGYFDGPGVMMNANSFASRMRY